MSYNLQSGSELRIDAMSEFQYYEFQALDRALTDKEMSEMRKVSSRARISPKKFINFYSYGDFQGDEDKWMDKHFDAFLYMANWGTRRLILRFPNDSIDRKLIKQFCPGEVATFRTTKGHTIIEYCIDDCDEHGWLEEENDFLDAISPVRSELLSNDYRLLYLGWLLCVQYGDLSGDAVEPPVPLGLCKLSKAQKYFVEFFNLDPELLKLATLTSPARNNSLIEDKIEPLISGMTEGEKRQWLCRLALHDRPALQSEFRKFLLANTDLNYFSNEPRRTVDEIQASEVRPIRKVG